MKFILALLVAASASTFAAPAKKAMPAPKEDMAIRKNDQKIKEPNALDKKPEDCDDKAKKPVEITPDAISLGGGNTGCSLEEANP